MTNEELQAYSELWANGTNVGKVWNKIKAKFLSGFHDQTGYDPNWRATARTNLGLGTPAEGSIWIGGGASTPITTLATSAHGRTILSSTLSAGEIWYGVDSSTLGKVVSTALGRGLMAATIGANEVWYGSAANTLGTITTTALGRTLMGATIAKDKMWYASAANTLDVVTTTAFGRGLLSAASQTVVTNLYADRAKYDLRGSEISATYGKDLGIDTSGTDAYLKLKNNAATSAFIGTGIIINKASGLVRLDSNAHIPLGLFPDSILGQLTYGGTVSAYSSATRIQIVMTASAKRIMEQRKDYAANTLDGKNIYLENLATPTTHTSSSYYFNYADCKGMYFIWTEAALATHTGEVKYRDWAGERYESGDWLTTNEEAWKKVDNTDAVTAVKGKMQSDWQTGNVELDALKVGALATYLTNTTQTVQDNVNFKKNVSVDGGVSAEGLCDLSLGGIGGGSGTVQSVQIGSGSPISPAQGSGGNVILAVETPSANGRIKLGGTEIAVSGLAALAYKANLSLSELQNATDIQAIQTISTGGANGFLVRASDGTWSFDTSQYAASSRVSTLEGYFSSGILKPANMPVATDSALGGVKVGTSLAISSGVLNVKTGGVTNDMLAGSIANNKLASGGKFTIGSQDIVLGTTYTQANFRSYLGLGSAALKADTYFATQTDFESAVMTLSGGLGTLQSMIEDNKVSIEGHDDRITDLEGYFTDGIPTGAVDAVGFANNQFTWSKGGVAQTPFTIGYATEAGKATNDKNGNDITATYLPLTGGVLKPNGGNTPLGLQPKNSSDVDVNMAYMNGGGTAMGYIGVKVVNNVSTPYFKATASGTAYGLIHEGNKNSLFTLFENDNEQLSATIGGENKKVTVDYASKATDIKNEDKENQTFAFRQTAGGALTYAPTSANLMRVKGNTLVWNQLIPTEKIDFTNSYTDTRQELNIRITWYGESSSVGEVICASTVGHQSFILTAPSETVVNCRIKHNGATSDIYIVDRQYLPVISSHKYLFMYDIKSADPTTVGGIVIKNLICIDITLFFNGNIPEGLTVETFERDYGYLLANPEYNEGQLINNAAEGLETGGFNIWDEEWEVGSINTSGQDVDGDNRFRSKSFTRVQPNTSYYFQCNSGDTFGLRYYDVNKNFISWTSMSLAGTFTTPSNAAYLRFVCTSGNTYNHDICINRSDTARNGTYEPYKRTETTLNLHEIKVKSPNIWDEEWEEGIYSTTTGEKISSAGAFRCKNAIPVKEGTTYYIKNGGLSGQNYYLWVMFRDKDSNLMVITGTSKYVNGNNTSVVAPIGAKEMIFYVVIAPSGYGNDICINVSDSAFNGKYFPHGVLTFNGLKQAGDVRDEIVGNRLIQRVGVVDMGTLTYTFTSGRFYTPLGEVKIGGSSICSKYITAAATDVVNNRVDKAVAISGTAELLLVRDTDFNDADTFKTAMSGVMLYYELATPIEYKLVDPFPTSYPVDILGTESIVSNGLVAPFVADIRYGAKQGDILASGIPYDKIYNRPTLKAGALTDASVSSDVNNGEYFKLDVGGQILYVKFVVGTGAFKLQFADAETNPTLSKEFEFATLTDSDIDAICV